LGTFRYAAGLQTGTLINFSLEVFYKAFVSSNYGVAYLALFQVAWRLIQIMQGVLSAALRPLFPASAFLLGQGDREGLYRAFSKATRYATVLGSSALALFLPFAQTFFRLWLGSTDPFQTVTSQMLCVWVFLSTVAAPGYLFIMGSGKAKFCVIAQAVASIAALLFVIAAPVMFGGYPYFLVGLSYAVGGLVGLVLTFWFVRRVFAWDILRVFWKESCVSFLVALSLVLAATLLIRRMIVWPLLDYVIFVVLFAMLLAAGLRMMSQETREIWGEIRSALWSVGKDD
jgi:O-antigen/teichoic acid export membrane protein